MGQSVLAADEVLITDPFLKEAIGKKLKKPYGKYAPPMKLTKADLAKVTFLDFDYTKITDAGLKDISKMQQLTDLRLWGTEITDAGLKDVAKMQQLTALDLSNCKQITAEDVAELKKAMPN